VSLDGEVKQLVHLALLLGREICQGFDASLLVSFQEVFGVTFEGRSSL
jgi:hypothetical protein